MHRYFDSSSQYLYLENFKIIIKTLSKIPAISNESPPLRFSLYRFRSFELLPESPQHDRPCPDRRQGLRKPHAIHFGSLPRQQLAIPHSHHSSSDLAVSQVNLDSQPSKGASQGINILGQMGVDVTLKQVQIVTSLNGTPLNTQYDPNTSAFHAGDTVNYRFAVTIPSFAPSVIFICFEKFY